MIKEFVPLAELKDIEFGGWTSSRTTLMKQPATRGVLDRTLLDQLRPELEQIRPMPAVFEQNL